MPAPRAGAPLASSHYGPPRPGAKFRKPHDAFLTVAQAAEELNMSVSSTYRLIRAGYLKTSMRPTGGRSGTGGKPRLCVPRDEIERYLGTLRKTRKAS